jgi:hypothetical protein
MLLVSLVNSVVNFGELVGLISTSLRISLGADGRRQRTVAATVGAARSIGW